MSKETITVADVSEGVGGSDETETDSSIDLPAVELLTGRGFITGKSGSGKSILEGTPVHTEAGRKPIEEVEKGERVLSLNKRTYKQEFREVQATIEHTDDRLIRVTLEDGTTLVGTADHSFLTADGLEIVPIRGDELEEGVWMPLSRTLPSPESKTEIDLAEYLDDVNNIRVDGGVIQSGPRTESRHRSLDFEFGKEVGLYLAEGSFDSGLTLQITNVDSGIRSFLEDRGYNPYNNTCNKGFRPFVRFLESEFGRGAGDKRIPNWVYDASSSFRAGILSGYFDGDGTIEERTVTVLSKSESLVSGMQELLRQFGISSTVRDKFTLYDEEKRRFRRLRVDAFSIDTFAEVVELSHEDKSTALATVVQSDDETDDYNSRDMVPNFGPVLNTAARESGWTERESDHRVDSASVHSLTRKQKAGRSTYNRLVNELGIEGRAKLFGESDVQWKRVVEIEELDAERTVYDLDVAVNDNFIANGVFVHNSNTASVIIEKLLDNRFSTLIVDTDGEYYGLKEEYEILHVGADEECDIVVSPEHAEKIAELALEQNIPIILDVSSFLDESEAEELLLNVTRQLFAKEKKLKKPFLMLVEEVHEYIPEGGGMSEVGKMLIKVGKRGRKHGLGIVGISQRPADVKKDYITQCDWLVWHRLTWQNDTKVVGRILGSEYADAIEEMADGEAFMMTDWSESLRRVQFHRKQTFDAGATPGLDDFERPELKSVSSDLVSELSEISEETERRESKIADLQQELDKKRQRIQQLERELEEARDLSEMADQFAQAMLQKSGASYRGGDGRNPSRDDDGQAGLDDYEQAGDPAGTPAGERQREETPREGASPEETPKGESPTDESPTDDPQTTPDADPSERARPGIEDPFGDATAYPGTDGSTSDGPAMAGDAEPTTETAPAGTGTTTEPSDSGPESETGQTDDQTTDLPVELDAGLGEKRPIVSHLRALIAELDPVSREMLAHYREHGPTDPVAAHVAVGGSGDTNVAYSRNRPLRQTGLVEHHHAGEYVYALPDIVRETYADRLAEEELVAVVQAVEESVVDETHLDATPWADGVFGTSDADELTPADDAEGASEGVEVLKHEEPAPAEKPDRLHGLDTPDDAEVVESDDAGQETSDADDSSESDSETDAASSDGAEILDQ
jgi:intein/homing endonuclease/TolA-binding protein